MKKFFICLPPVFCFLLLFSFENTEAQFLKKLKNEVKSRAENNIINKAGNATDRAIDNTADAATQKKNTNETVDTNTQNPSNDTNVAENKNPKPTVVTYKNYDFVPGDKIIFQPDLSAEPDAELPARFSVKAGNAEIQTFEGEKIIHLQKDGYATIAPLMSSEKYLPEQFTLEFDMMLENEASYFKYVSNFYVNFRKKEDMNYRSSPLFKFVMYGISAGAFGDQNAGRIAFSKNVEESFGSGNTWHHIAIYVRKNIGKVYIDQNRVIATNNLTVGADKVDIRADRYGIKIKNFRLAAGGDDKYNKVITDGKFISHGILFDVNKSTIKPESMGALNEIAKLMKAHNDLKFEIDGHTDSDGSGEANMKLSQSRADAVKEQLVKMGIDEDRLTTKGFGESKPIDKNDTAEGKANNRRVEFIKI
jgi:outer membrane protein OmpA-like peptidoglycan-associated protein